MELSFLFKCVLAAIGVWVMFYVPHIAAKDSDDYDSDWWS